MRSLSAPYRALVIGSSGSIGSAFVQALEADERCAGLVGLSRNRPPHFHLEDEASIAAAAQWARTALDQSGFALIVDATGALTIDGQGPEKRLSQVSAQGLRRAFEINAIGRALVLKHFIPLLPPKGRAIFAVLSARVGSISDNHLGGWYGYRASKAAGNMLLQTAAIESYRTRPEAVFAALQPGTVISKLSAPFQAGHATLAAQDSVAGMLTALDGLAARPQAWFIDYQGQPIDW
ncbi:MAG: SDR family NAD(P)-dependent oxidoreductase [Betaproteobacteria bacterium]|nr:SDR family NAD(P)-dependent oxidoreductase [Betaproteobacteria bacterium]